MRRAWSVRLILLAAILSGLEVANQVIVAFNVTLPIPPGAFAVMAGLVSMLALIARFWAQERNP